MLELNLMQMRAVSGGVIVLSGSGGTHKELRKVIAEDGSEMEIEVEVIEVCGGDSDGFEPLTEHDPISQDKSDIGKDGKLTPEAKKVAEAAAKGAQAQAKAERAAEQAESLRVPSNEEIAINKNTEAIKDNTRVLERIADNTTKPKEPDSVQKIIDGMSDLTKEVLKEGAKKVILKKPE